MKIVLSGEQIIEILARHAYREIPTLEQYNGEIGHIDLVVDNTNREVRAEITVPKND